jgi:hypothetical protein
MEFLKYLYINNWPHPCYLLNEIGPIIEREGLPCGRLCIVLDKMALRAHEEVVEAHSGDLVAQPTCRVLPQRLERFVLPSPLVELADQLHAFHEKSFGE